MVWGINFSAFFANGNWGVIFTLIACIAALIVFFATRKEKILKLSFGQKMAGNYMGAFMPLIFVVIIATSGLIFLMRVADQPEVMRQFAYISIGVIWLMAIVGGYFGYKISQIFVVTIIRPLIDISKDLSTSSSNSVEVAHQLASAAQQLSAASHEQSNSIVKTSASLQELSGMVNQNVDYAQKSNDLSQSVKQTSDQGNESMKKLIHSMNDILESNENISKLVEVIGEIGRKTSVINDIVFKTSLLSFNASIEAARAGQHGKGFAVVAEEVGNLARMSGEAAAEISKIVDESIKNAEILTAENKKIVEEGHQQVQEAASILKEVSETATTVSAHSAHILSASKEQSQGIEQINDAMSQIDRATKENTSTSESAAKSGKKVDDQATQLNKLADDLKFLIIGHQ